MNGGGDGCADGGGGGVSGVDVGVGSVGVGTGVDGLAARVLGVPKAVPEAAPKAAPKATPEAVPEAAPEAAPAAGARRLAHSSGARRLRPRRAGRIAEFHGSRGAFRSASFLEGCDRECGAPVFLIAWQAFLGGRFHAAVVDPGTNGKTTRKYVDVLGD